MQATKEKIIEIKEGNVTELKLQLNEVNDLDKDGFQLLNDTVTKCAKDESLRVLVLTSGANGFFSNGLKPELFLDRSESEIRDAVRLVLDTAEQLFFFPVPAIIAINGHCLGAGSVFAIYSDYRLMADKKARIGFPEMVIGMNFPSIAVRYLESVVGHRNAKELMFGGRPLKGPEAKSIGLVDEIYPEEELNSKAHELARKLASNAPSSLRGIKASMRHSYRPLLESLREWDIEETVKTILTKNCQEGFRSILEKRRPNFG